MNKLGRKTKNCSRMAAVIVSGSILYALPVFAAEKPETSFSLDPMVITAQKIEKSDLNTPAAITVITAEELKETGAATVFDALEHTIGFNSMSFGPAGREYGLSAGRTIIRGLDKGTLVLVNGAPANLLNYNGSAGIPLEAVERVEVSRGANAVLYGAEALTGVVNIITKKPDGEQGSFVGGTVGNYNSEWISGNDLGDTLLYVKRQYIGDIDKTSRDNIFASSGKAVQYYGLDKSNNDSFYLTTKISKDLVFNWSYNNLNANRPRYNADGSDYIFYTYDDIRNNMNLIYDNAEDSVKSVFSFNKRRAYADKYTYSTKKWALSERNNMYSINWDNQKTWKLRDDKDTLIAGLTLAREHYYDPSTEHAAVRQNARRDSAAVYGAYTYAASDDLSIILGMRGETLDDYATNENVFLPQLQTLYKLNEKTSWFTNVGKSFQMAAINQYFKKKDADFNQLKPQQGWNYETGIKIIDGDDSWKLSVYHLDIKDQFVWKKNVDDSDYMANGGDFRNTGVEVEYGKILNDEWKYNLGLSYSNPENNETGKWIQSNSRFQGIAGVNYHKSKFNGNVNFLYLGDRETSYYKINGVTSDIPNRIQLNSNLSYVADKKHSFSLKLNNLLDRDNSVNKYENLDLPFNWELSYQYKF